MFITNRFPETGAAPPFIKQACSDAGDTTPYRTLGEAVYASFEPGIFVAWPCRNCLPDEPGGFAYIHLSPRGPAPSP